MKFNKIEIIYYALGGGLGHLSRAIAFCQTKKILKEKVLILTASAHAKEVLKGYQFLCLPLSLQNDIVKYKNYLEKLIKTQRVHSIYLDSFPCGILGEWNALSLNSNIKFYYVARLLKWNEYQKYISSSCLRFEKSFIVEKLSPEHQKWLSQNSEKETKLKLNYPVLKAKYLHSIFEIKKTIPIWLIVHSEPKQEVNYLLNYAIELADIQGLSPQFIVISKTKLRQKKGVIYFNDFPAYPYFEGVEKIFTACGFNLMQQSLKFRYKHHFIPFQRKFDNQFQRAKLSK